MAMKKILLMKYILKKVSIRYEPSPKKDASFTGIIWGHKLLNGRDMFWIGELDTSFNSSDGISNLYGFSKEIDEDILKFTMMTFYRLCLCV